uniref:Uncharacterized protein n=1 Tax=viral metagenome TaxID=1070528 RepID=A0A6M3J4Z7_9ZZZZ
MSTEVCPICSGEGKYKRRKCHGCDGKGWVTPHVVESLVTSSSGGREYEPSEIPVVYNLKGHEPNEEDGQVWHIVARCPTCHRAVFVGRCPEAEKKRPKEILLPCGDIQPVVFKD